LHGEEILKCEGIKLPRYEILEFMEVFEKIKYKWMRHKTFSSKRILQRRLEYEENKHRLNYGMSLVHSDPKFQNRRGKYWIDLEGLCLGDPALDLAMILNDPKMIINDDLKKAYISLYHHFYAKEKGIEFRQEDVNELLERVKGATLIKSVNSLAWNLVHLEEESKTRLEKINYMAHII